MTAEFWSGRRVFITGHTGFKGAWLALWLNKLRAKVVGYSLPAPTMPSLFEAAQVAQTLRSLEGDVRDLERLRAGLREAAPEVVFHLAAQALVRTSYEDPVGTFSANLLGTVHLLEACRAAPALRAVIIVTSDKCYEESSAEKPRCEGDSLGGHDPYAASKACAEIATAAYRRSYFMPDATRIAVASARAGNVIGGGDWAADRLLPDLVRAFNTGRRARIRNPGATRPWQHVLDPLSGYMMLAERLSNDGQDFAEAWNFGPPPGGSVTVGEIADRAARIWGPGAAWEPESTPQPREASALVLDPGKANRRLAWKPWLGFDAALDWTVPWYKSWYQGSDARALAESQIERFMEVQSS